MRFGKSVIEREMRYFFPKPPAANKSRPLRDRSRFTGRPSPSRGLLQRNICECYQCAENIFVGFA